MRIDFAAMEEQIVPHMRDGEKEVALRTYTDGQCKIMRGRLIPGASIGLHTHETNSEIIYVLEGQGMSCATAPMSRWAPAPATTVPRATPTASSTTAPRTCCFSRWCRSSNHTERRAIP